MFSKIKVKESLFICLLLVGCADELKKKEESNDGKVVQLNSNQIKVQVTGLAQPNSYEIHLEWPDAKGTVRVSGDTKILGVVSGSEKKFTHSLVKGGTEITYLVEQLTSDGRISSSIPVFVRVPQDIFWDEPIELTDHMRVTAERLFISNRAVITTNDKILTLAVKELIAEGGTIQNFKEDTVAGFERNGRSGGSIGIVAEKASGSLQVNLSGEDGGHGKNGVNYHVSNHPGCAGTSGGNGGNAGSLNVNIFEGESLNISVSNREGKFGQAGKKGSVSGGPRTEAVYPPCDRYDRNGVDGQPGSKGQVCLKLSEGRDYVCN